MEFLDWQASLDFQRFGKLLKPSSNPWPACPKVCYYRYNSRLQWKIAHWNSVSLELPLGTHQSHFCETLSYNNPSHHCLTASHVKSSRHEETISQESGGHEAAYNFEGVILNIPHKFLRRCLLVFLSCDPVS